MSQKKKNILTNAFGHVDNICLAFPSFDCERTWPSLFQKRVVLSKLNIYV